MTLPQFSMRYENCSDEELVQILQRRTKYARRSPSRVTCLVKLTQLDRDVTFRFLDLAPELRNAVYEEVLHHNDETERFKRYHCHLPSHHSPVPASTAYPALLRVSRQVNKEARGILYGQSSITVDAVSLEYGREDPRSSLISDALPFFSSTKASDSPTRHEEAGSFREGQDHGMMGSTLDAKDFDHVRDSGRGGRLNTAEKSGFKGVHDAFVNLSAFHSPGGWAKSGSRTGKEFKHRTVPISREELDEEARVEHEQRLAALDSPELFHPLRNFRHLTLFIRDLNGRENREVLMKLTAALVTTFNDQNALTTLKLFYVRRSYTADNLDALPKGLCPLSKLPKTTELEFAAFPEGAKEKVREAVERSA